MGIKLTDREIAELRRIQKKEKFHRRRFVKATVLLMLHSGLTVEEICRSLSLDDNTLYRYTKAFQEKGLEDYLKDNYVGCQGKLTAGQERALVSHLENNLYSDCKAICAYVRGTFGVDFTVTGMRDLLHRLGFVYKKTKPVPSNADEEAQQSFLKSTLPQLLEEVAGGEAEVYFADGAHPTHNTRAGYGWIRKGKEYKIGANTGRIRVNINAAIRATKPDHVVFDIADCVNAQSTQRLCRKLLKKHPGKKIYYVCDNARYYHCSWLKKWAAGTRIEFVFLPSYSPNLNIIERLWRFMRKKVIDGIYYDSYDKFRKNIYKFFMGIKRHKNELRKLMSLNFRTIGGASFHLSQTSS